MSDYDQLYADLRRHINSLQNKFLDPFLPADPSIKPDDYEPFVKAYCILCHAALEDFFESVSLKVMTQSLDKWLFEKRCTDTLLTLICNYGLKFTIDDNEANLERKTIDYLRPIMDEAKVRFSRDIFDNHGASVKYLRKLMVPIAIDIKNDVILGSLKKIAQERGEYAHRQVIKKVLSPEDAKNYMKDCLAICDDIKSKANFKFLP
jgi:hypothetical protein